MREIRAKKPVSYAESTPSESHRDDSDDEATSVTSRNEGVDNEDDEDDEDNDDHDELDNNSESDEGPDGEDEQPKKRAKITAQATKSSKPVSSRNGKQSAGPKAVSKSKVKDTVSTSSLNRSNSAVNSVTRPSNSCASSSSVPFRPAESVPNQATDTNNNMSTFQGPPVTTDAGAKKLLTQYMRQQNRPYSSQQLFDNLHKRIPKATLERVLALLSAPAEGLICKEYGKAKIYYVDQAFLPAEKSASQLEALKSAVNELQQEVKTLIQRDKEAKSNLSSLLAEPDDADLEAKITEAEERVAQKIRKIDSIMSTSSSTGKKTNPASLRMAIEAFNNKRKAWFERKALCMNAVDLLSDAMGKKRSVLMVSKSR